MSACLVLLALVLDSVGFPDLSAIEPRTAKPDRRGTSDAGSRAHDDLDPTEIRGHRTSSGFGSLAA
jgi:hypothetical protein